MRRAPDITECPLCELEGPDSQWVRVALQIRIECKRCGRYSADIEILSGAAVRQDENLARFLPAYTRQATERGQKVTLTIEHWQELARSHSQTSVTSNLRRLLEVIGHKTIEPGAHVTLNFSLDYPLVDVQSEEAFHYLLKALHEMGQIHLIPATAGFAEVYVKPQGWKELQMAGQMGFIPGRCFVAMWFDDCMNEACDEGFKAAIEECGFDPVLIRDVHFNDDVCDRILAEIRMAEFVVADFTGNRAGVYFEAGFAKALGRQVIFTVREDEMETVHFDTNHYNHITWKDVADLKQKLKDRIRATVAGSR